MRLFLLLALCLTFSQAKSQVHDSLVQRPGPSNSKDATALSSNPTSNQAHDENFICNAWTMNGAFFTQRTYAEYDLSSIPANATIDSAFLSLWCNTTSTHTQRHSMYPGSPYDSNQSFIRRITSNWNLNTLTWNNQPATTTLNQIVVPASISATQDYQNINVTNIVHDAVADPNNVNSVVGFMLMLETELKFRSLIFASGDHPDPTKRPKFVVYYTLPRDTSTTHFAVVQKSINVMVYPNPANNLLHINSNVIVQNASITLSDISGRVVYAQTSELTTQPVTIDISKSTPGYYILNISSENGIIERRKILVGR